MAPAELYARATRDLERFAALWSLSVSPSAPDFQDAWTGWTVDVRGGNWTTTTDYRFFRWDDVMASERSRGWAPRLVLGVGAMADFLLGGAAFGYLRTSWRYLLFFLYPIILLALIAATAGLGAIGGLGLLGHSSPIWTIPTGCILFAVLLPILGNRLYLDHLLDDWIHAMCLVRGAEPQVDARLNAVAHALNRAAADEILVLGHSLGAVLGADLIARMLANGYAGAPIRFATAGSSILKIGLHRKARTLRANVQTLALSGRVVWADFQALNDVMNFYKSEPVAALGIDAPPAIIRTVRFRSMVRPDRYKRLERNFFRLHNQFVHANDVRAKYDVAMMTAGPFPLESLVASDDGAMSLLDETGALTEAGQRACERNARAEQEAKAP